MHKLRKRASPGTWIVVSLSLLVQSAHARSEQQETSAHSSLSTALLVVGGWVNKDGTASLTSVILSRHGQVTQNVPTGNLTLRVYDAAGQILAEVTHELAFETTICIDFTEGCKTSPVLAPMFSIGTLYPRGARRLELLFEGKVVKTELFISRILHDTVGDLPEVAFLHEPSESKQMIRERIKEIQDRIEQGDDGDARQAFHVLHGLVQQSLANGQIKELSWALDKKTVLELLSFV
jgi:hypothetical protein